MTGYPFSFFFMTNKPEVASFATMAGADFIFVDLEVNGKAERQRGRNTIISGHTIDDIRSVRKAIGSSARVLARVNPLHERSREEIDGSIDAGADLIMLPMYRSSQDAARFVDLIGGRAETCLLLETREALETLEDTVRLPGVHRIHVGLNDLHISMGLPFMYLLLGRGIMDRIASTVLAKAPHIAFGFGGGALLDARHPVSPSDVLAEHVRVGSHAIILSRTFHGDPQSEAELSERMDLQHELGRIRRCVAAAAARTSAQAEADRARIAATIEAAARERMAGQTGV